MQKIGTFLEELGQIIKSFEYLKDTVDCLKVEVKELRLEVERTIYVDTDICEMCNSVRKRSFEIGDCRDKKEYCIIYIKEKNRRIEFSKENRTNALSIKIKK